MSDDDSLPSTADVLRRRQDLVLRRFVEGMTIPKISEYLRRHGFEAARETPYQDIARATGERMLHYSPPPGEELVKRLLARFSTEEHPLRDVFVPSYGGRMATISAAADACARAIWSIANKKVEGRAAGYTDRRTGEDVPPYAFPCRYPSRDGGEPCEGPYAEVAEKVPEKDIDPDPLVIEIRIGFCGGDTMSLACEDLGAALAQEVEAVEKTLKNTFIEGIRKERPEARLPEGVVLRRFKIRVHFVFVNLVSGFDRIPSTNPIAFLPKLLNEAMLEPRTKIDIFNAMPFAPADGTVRVDDAVKAIPSLKAIHDDAKNKGFDVILTSGSSIDDPHNMFERYFCAEDRSNRQLVGELIERLTREGVEGDFLWMPLGVDRPFDLLDLWRRVRDEGNTELAALLRYQPMTLLSLQQIAEHVANRRDVFLLLAPCGVCNLEKSRIARAALGQRKQIVTHLYVDRDTAECLLAGQPA